MIKDSKAVNEYISGELRCIMGLAFLEYIRINGSYLFSVKVFNLHEKDYSLVIPSTVLTIAYR